MTRPENSTTNTSAVAALTHIQHLLYSLGMSTMLDPGCVPGDVPMLHTLGAVAVVAENRYQVTPVYAGGEPRGRSITLALSRPVETVRLMEAYDHGDDLPMFPPQAPGAPYVFTLEHAMPASPTSDEGEAR